MFSDFSDLSRFWENKFFTMKFDWLVLYERFLGIELLLSFSD